MTSADPSIIDAVLNPGVIIDTQIEAEPLSIQSDGSVEIGDLDDDSDKSIFPRTW